MTEGVVVIKPAVDKHRVSLFLLTVEATPRGKITLLSRVDYDVFKDGEQINPDAINIHEATMAWIEQWLKGEVSRDLNDETQFESIF